LKEFWSVTMDGVLVPVISLNPPPERAKLCWPDMPKTGSQRP
jgi:hypothetical protein